MVKTGAVVYNSKTNQNVVSEKTTIFLLMYESMFLEDQLLRLRK